MQEIQINQYFKNNFDFFPFGSSESKEFQNSQNADRTLISEKNEVRGTEKNLPPQAENQKNNQDKYVKKNPGDDFSLQNDSREPIIIEENILFSSDSQSAAQENFSSSLPRLKNENLAQSSFDSRADFHFDSDPVLLSSSGGFNIFVISSRVLDDLAYAAFERLSFFFTKSHIEHLIKMCFSEKSSSNDRFVCSAMLQNALTASEGKLALCQDTGIANIFAWKKGGFFVADPSDFSSADNANLESETEKSDSYVSTEYDALQNGTARLYKERNLRFSTVHAKSFFDEIDPQNNLPCQIAVFQDFSCLAPLPPFVKNAPLNSMSFLFCAKGGGSSNKTVLVQGTKALLNESAFKRLISEQLLKLGTSACPPYTIAVVAGGLSPEQNLLTLKLATCDAYENLTRIPNEQAFRCEELEEYVFQAARETGFGAQFTGSAFALNAVVIRLPRHAAGFPVSVGVSCAAHRNLKSLITKSGIYIEKIASDLHSIKDFDKAAKLFYDTNATGKIIRADTMGGIQATLEQLKGAKVGDKISLSGFVIVARDSAHARWKALVDSDQPLPDYTMKYPIFYAGPARTPKGKITGSIGPTTAGRMDVYADMLMSRGASLITLAKGNRSEQWRKACARYKAFYLGVPGGTAALIAENHILSQRVIDYPELGMEAVRLTEVKNLPCFVITDAQGSDLYTRHPEN